MFYADNFCTYTESIENGEQFYTFTGPCRMTKKPYSVKVPGAALYAYRQGALIQNAFPMLSKDDREFLISGFSPEGWAQVFPPEEDDDDEGEELLLHDPGEC